MSALFNSFVSHLECSDSGTTYAADQLYNLSTSGHPLLVRYDLDGLGACLTRDNFKLTAPGFWQYGKLLPPGDTAEAVTLGEILTPLISIDAHSSLDAPQQVWIKDEGLLPTGSFKARGVAMAVTMARALGVTRMAMPTNGNAGAALAAYGAKAGMEVLCYCPSDTPAINIEEMRHYGAEVHLHPGLIHDCGKEVQARCRSEGWFDTSTLKEPYRIEGKKTMGIELAEQFNWQLPDYIFYPTGGGTGLIGMWKAFKELQALGWIEGELPKMICVQAEGCAPLVNAFEQHQKHAETWENARTVAAGIRVPKAIGDFLVLDAVRESAGFAISVSDPAIIEARDRIARRTGFLMCPEGAATAAALQKAQHLGLIEPASRVVLFNCATGLKYLS
ncbi:MAG: threonine synthase [Pseudomonadales bacterium]